MRIVIPGGGGQVGAILNRAFTSQGHEVIILSRRAASGPWHPVHWDGRSVGEWGGRIDGADVVINLAGRSVNCRYNAENRREIMDSRVESTRAVGEAIAQAKATASRMASGEHRHDLLASIRRTQRRNHRHHWWVRSGRSGHLAIQH